jgi:hypothetical protein
MAFLMSLIGFALSPTVSQGRSADFMIYSIYRNLSLGTPGEVSEKDYYINMGTAHGLQKGSLLQVLRRVSTYDVLSEQLYRDVAFPIATVKVIHVESKVAIARLEKLMPADTTPSITPRAIMIGDVVETAGKSE